MPRALWALARSCGRRMAGGGRAGRSAQGWEEGGGAGEGWQWPRYKMCPKPIVATTNPRPLLLTAKYSGHCQRRLGGRRQQAH